MESFNRVEHVVAAFLDVEKAFDNAWHNGLRYKIFQLDLPTKRTRWLSDFLVGHVIQVNINGFLSNQINLKAGVPEGSVLSPLLFLIYVNDLPSPHHKQNSLSQFTDDTAQWAFSLNVHFTARITFDSQLNFKKHFEDILDRCNTRYHCLGLLANKKWGPSPATLIQIYKQCS